jgi:hypothetical protein
MKHLLNIIDDKVVLMSALSISMTLTNIETILKILVLLLTVIYTGRKIYKDFKN